MLESKARIQRSSYRRGTRLVAQRTMCRQVHDWLTDCAIETWIDGRSAGKQPFQEKASDILDQVHSRLLHHGFRMDAHETEVFASDRPRGPSGKKQKTGSSNGARTASPGPSTSKQNPFTDWDSYSTVASTGKPTSNTA